MAAAVHINETELKVSIWSEREGYSRRGSLGVMVDYCSVKSLILSLFKCVVLYGDFFTLKLFTQLRITETFKLGLFFKIKKNVRLKAHQC